MSEDLILEITGSGQDAMPGSCNESNKPSGDMKGGNSFQNLNNCQLLKTDSDDGVSAQLWHKNTPKTIYYCTLAETETVPLCHFCIITVLLTVGVIPINTFAVCLHL
jgi:hypothetical protein